MFVRRLARMSRLGRRKTSIVVIIVGLGFIVFLSVNGHSHTYLKDRARSYFNGTPLVGGHLTTARPNHDNIVRAEKALPQHNLSLPYPEGQHGRYVKFTNQIRGLGWNNVLNEVLLCSHLAWRAKRAYVFQDYYWKVEHYPWRIYPWPWPQTPLNALIAGPTAGGSWDMGDDTPRSVREDHWPQVCPPQDTEIIYTQAAKEPIRGTDAKYVLEHWLRLLNESPKRCVEIVPELDKDNWPQTFDLWTISTSRILPIWPQFRDSPVSRLLKTSPLVQSAVKRNEHHFFSPKSQSLADPYDTLMAIHIRRGDYLEACQGFSDYGSSFYQWNLLPELPDAFHEPSGVNASERHALFFQRCFPTDDDILAKIRQSKQEWETGGHHGVRRKLTSLFIMTNAEARWKAAFKPLMLADGWEFVVFGSELDLNAEQTEVGMVVDMDIGRMAGLFIGNGWSSMTSNIVHRRLVDGHDPSSIRFW